MFISKLGTAGSASVSASDGQSDYDTIYITPAYGLSISYYAYVPYAITGYAAVAGAEWPTATFTPHHWYGFNESIYSSSPSNIYDDDALEGNLSITAYTKGIGSEAAVYASW